MLTIRFARVGKKNRAQFKIMLQEHTVAPGGRHVEILGSYDPHLKQTALNEDRIKYWISKGAQASDSVYNLLVSKGIIEGKKRSVKIPEKKVEAPTAPAEGSENKEKVATEGAGEVAEEAPKEEAKKEEVASPAEAPEAKEAKPEEAPEAPKEEG